MFVLPYTETAGGYTVEGMFGPFASNADALGFAQKLLDRFSYLVPEEPVMLESPQEAEEYYMKKESQDENAG